VELISGELTGHGDQPGIGAVNFFSASCLQSRLHGENSRAASARALFEAQSCLAIQPQQDVTAAML
jgi:hypothetical protein